MLNHQTAHDFAKEWINAWNSHNLDRIMDHYAEEVVLVSPVAARIINNSEGIVRGKPALLAYFQKGLEAYPQLKFDLIDVMWGISSVVLHYRNQRGTKSAEFMELDSNGAVLKVVANYSD